MAIQNISNASNPVKSFYHIRICEMLIGDETPSLPYDYKITRLWKQQLMIKNAEKKLKNETADLQSTAHAGFVDFLLVGPFRIESPRSSAPMQTINPGNSYLFFHRYPSSANWKQTRWS